MNKKDWNFDEVIDRRSSYSMKWDPDMLVERFGEGKGDLLALWVADMDFKSPTVVKNAIIERLEHQIYGYSLVSPDYLTAVLSWLTRRFQWNIEKEWIVTTPGIVPAISYIVQTFTNPEDKIIIQSPVYYPFSDAIRNNGRQILENPLQIVNNRYIMDFEDLKKKVKDPRVKVAILCSPHNPVGRVWTKEELQNFGNICIDNGALVFSDEIHADLIMPGFKHINFALLSEKFAQYSITAISASKTFNLAGLQHSSIIIPNKKMRTEFLSLIENLGFVNLIGGTLFGAIGAAAAYNHAEQWLNELIEYLYENYIFLKSFFKEHLPSVIVHELQGTYLVWADFRNLELSGEKVSSIIEKNGRVALDHGIWFGENGNGFERFNIGCPRIILEEAVERIYKAFTPFI